MASIDTVKRINVDEFKDDDKEIAERIGNVYNYFAEQVTNAINGNLDYENLNRALITLTVIVDVNGTPSQTTRFAAKVGVKGTHVIRAVNTTNRVNFVEGQPFISYLASGDGFYTIENIKGLNTGDQYTLYVELIF